MAEPLPAWYAALLRLGLSGLLGLSLTGLPLAMLGWFRPLPVALAALAAAAGVWRLWPAPRPAPPAGRAATLAAAAVVALAVALTLANARWSGQYLLATRDPGVYALTGVWLADEGTLVLPGLEEPFTGHPGLRVEGQGFHPTPGGDLYAQGYHLLPVLLAVGAWVGGTALLVKVNAVVGGAVLLVLYAFASRLMRPWFAAAATAAVGLGLAQVVFTRDPYSEPLSQLLLFAALWAMWEGRAETSPRLAVVAGLLLGATAMVRVDATFYLIGAVAALGTDAVLSPPRSGAARWAGLVVAAAAPPFVLGVLDGLLFSRTYFDFLWDDVRLLLVALAAVAAGVAAALALRRPLAPVGRRLLAWRRPLAVAAAAAVVAAAAWAWFVRPETAVVRQSARHAASAFYEGLQAREGLPIDPLRTYAEDALPRLALYLGPVTLAAGLAGGALAVARQVAHGGRRWLPFLAILASSTAYLWSPQIVADQPWALRRFVVVTVPGLLVLALWLADRLWGRGLAGRLAGGALALVTVGFAVGTTAPVAGVRTQVPLLAATDALCDALPPDGAVVLLADGPLAANSPQTIRFRCEVPVAVMPVAGGPGPVADVVAAAEDEGFTPVVLSHTPTPFGPAATEVAATPVVVQPYEVVETTLEDRPDEEASNLFAAYRVDVSGASGNR